MLGLLSRVRLLPIFYGVSLLGISANVPWDTGISGLVSDDLRMIQGDARVEFGGLEWDNDFTASITHFDIDYRPASFDALGFETDRREDRFGARLQLEKRLRGNFSLNGIATAYKGFGDFQSIWLAEYYEQQFSDLDFPGFDTWEEPNPHGFAGALTGSWEFRPGLSKLELSVSQSADKISPGYEIDFDGLVQGLTWLTTTSVALRWEEVLTPRIRAIFQASVSETTEREKRWNGNARLFWSVSERLVLRADVGGATESPDFEAAFGGATLDWGISEQWAIIVGGRAYYDSGELQNDGLFSTAAPALRSYSYTLGTRYMGGNWAVRVAVGGVNSDYEEGNPDLDFFQNLYTDRDYLNFNASFSYGF